MLKYTSKGINLNSAGVKSFTLFNTTKAFKNQINYNHCLINQRIFINTMKFNFSNTRLIKPFKKGEDRVEAGYFDDGEIDSNYNYSGGDRRNSSYSSTRTTTSNYTRREGDSTIKIRKLNIEHHYNEGNKEHVEKLFKEHRIIVRTSKEQMEHDMKNKDRKNSRGRRDKKEENSQEGDTRGNLPISNPIMRFEELKIRPELKDELKVNYKTPSVIQSIGWPVALSGNNMVGIAETGSGKTLSFIIPALTHIEMQHPNLRSKEGPLVLMIAPTRELAMQIHKVVEDYCSTVKYRSVCLYGGVPKYEQSRKLRNGVEIVVATPGRLLDLINMGRTNLDRTSFVVLDEADRMLDMGFEKDLRRILSMVHPDSQMLMWSATWPVEIRKLAEEFLKDYIHIKIGQEQEGLAINSRIQQKFIFCHHKDKMKNLEELLTKLRQEGEEGVDEELDKINHVQHKPTQNKNFPKTMLFSNYKRGCDTLVYALSNNYSIDCIHGDKTQTERDRVISKFKRGEIDILVATDVAARGLDISDVKVIINYDFPKNLEDYVHRIGRTGRSGKTGLSYSLMSRDDMVHGNKLKKLLEKADQEIPEEISEPQSKNSSNSYRGRSPSSSPRGNFRGERKRYSESNENNYRY